MRVCSRCFQSKAVLITPQRLCCALCRARPTDAPNQLYQSIVHSCESTCILWHRPGTNDCGVQSSYACLDPSAVEYTGRPVTAHPRSTTTQAGVDTTTTQAGVDTTTTQADSVPTSTTTAGQEAPTTTTQDPVQITDDFSQNAGQPGTPDNSALDDTTVLGIAVGAVAAVVIVGVAVGIAVAVKKSQNQRKNSTYDGSIGSPFVRSHTASMKVCLHACC